MKNIAPYILPKIHAHTHTHTHTHIYIYICVKVKLCVLCDMNADMSK